jgi:hypothetical protein
MLHQCRKHLLKVNGEYKKDWFEFQQTEKDWELLWAFERTEGIDTVI